MGMDTSLENILKNRETVTNGSAGLNVIFKSCVASVTVVTPLGETMQFNTRFVGSDSTGYILLKLPVFEANKVNHFFQKGFSLTVKAIADHGEGSIVCFRSQLQSVISSPIGLLVLDIPATMQLHQLRSEPRFDVDMRANIIVDNERYQVELTDISNSGCGFTLGTYGRQFTKDELIKIEVINNQSQVVTALHGKICNSRKKKETISYGVVLSVRCKDQVNSLMSQLIFDGSKMCFADRVQDTNNNATSEYSLHH